MSASLVGSEMCIRDRCHTPPFGRPPPAIRPTVLGAQPGRQPDEWRWRRCLLYTSDAADDM
eukprot:1636972-Alexandrium_andersonii.AAC.1